MIEVALTDVQVVRLEIAVLRREGVEPVIRQCHGLGILEFGEHPWREGVVGLEAVALAGTKSLVS
jgi:hypothetical protein